jgi:hypothetical protein
MKDNLMIKQYNVIYDNGTKNMKTSKSFFGTKLIDIEDSITIDNISIKYTDIYGYQYFNTNPIEKETILNLSELKKRNHQIKLQTQNDFNISNNTIWEIIINIEEILRQYLFFKIKESRTFKTVKQEHTKNNDINLSIYDFINFNILNKYKIDHVDFYIKYKSILNNNKFDKSVQYDPIFDNTILKSENLIKNYTFIKKDEFDNLSNIKIIYNQIKNSLEYKFDYYFNLIYKRI